MVGEEATIIVFKNRPGTPNRELKRFCNQLYGYIDQSNRGAYTYHRKGLLGEIPHIHIDKVRSVIVTRKQDAPRVIELLEKFGAYHFSREVILGEKDWEHFTLKQPGERGGQERGQEPGQGQDAEAETQEDQ
jgi:hypothetical protein